MDLNEEELKQQAEAAETAETAENTADNGFAEAKEEPKPEAKAEEKTEAKSTWKKIFGKEDKPAEKTPQDRINELTLKLAEAERLRLLALAEMDNQRKRLAKEREQIRLNTTQDVVSPFLQVFDYFTMAVTMAEKSRNLDSLLQGMNMIQQLFDKALNELGVERIDAMGKKFDPLLHDAKEQRPSETVPAGIVMEQWSMGYKMGDRLLKPAMVIVSSGKPAPEAPVEPEATPDAPEAGAGSETPAEQD